MATSSSTKAKEGCEEDPEYSESLWDLAHVISDSNHMLVLEGVRKVLEEKRRNTSLTAEEQQIYAHINQCYDNEVAELSSAAKARSTVGPSSTAGERLTGERNPGGQVPPVPKSSEPVPSRKSSVSSNGTMMLTPTSTVANGEKPEFFSNGPGNMTTNNHVPGAFPTDRPDTTDANSGNAHRRQPDPEVKAQLQQLQESIAQLQQQLGNRMLQGQEPPPLREGTQHRIRAENEQIFADPNWAQELWQNGGLEAVLLQTEELEAIILQRSKDQYPQGIPPDKVLVRNRFRAGMAQARESCRNVMARNEVDMQRNANENNRLRETILQTIQRWSEQTQRGLADAQARLHPLTIEVEPPRGGRHSSNVPNRAQRAGNRNPNTTVPNQHRQQRSVNTMLPNYDAWSRFAQNMVEDIERHRRETEQLRRGIDRERIRVQTEIQQAGRDGDEARNRLLGVGRQQIGQAERGRREPRPALRPPPLVQNQEQPARNRNRSSRSPVRIQNTGRTQNQNLGFGGWGEWGWGGWGPDPGPNWWS